LEEDIMKISRLGTVPLGLAGSLVLAASLFTFQLQAQDAAKPVLAVAAFGFVDTSGELRDQTTEHATRLEAVNHTLLEGLGDASSNVEALALDCGENVCTGNISALPQMVQEARTAGARYLLFGQVQKMSTLIGSMRFAMLDLEANSAVCDRFLTYRGDTDEAWRRASNMLVEEIRQDCLGQEPAVP
jgi:hypothetical protein